MKWIFLFGIVFSLGSSIAKDARDVQVANLETFSRLYGYVRYFHPSDEAASIDWDQFVIYGANRVKALESREALKDVLESLFRPVAPTLQIFDIGAKPVLPQLPEGNDQLKVVAWQHWGLGGIAWDGTYQSKRTHRNPPLPGGHYLVMAQQIPDLGKYVGKTFKLEAEASFERKDYGAQARLMLAFIPKDGNQPYHTSREPLILSQSLKSTSYTAVMEDLTDTAVIGIQMTGVGHLRGDHFKFSVLLDDGSWKDIPIKNPEFNEKIEGTWPLDAMAESFNVKSVDVGGNSIVSIENKYQSLPEEDWENEFKELPAVHEMLERQIGSGLVCRFPMALYSDESGTLPKGNEALLTALNAELAKVETQKPVPEQYLGNAINIWNMLQHFYPYWNVVKVDFSAVLHNALRDLLEQEPDLADGDQIINGILTALEDSHAYCLLGGKRSITQRPFRVDRVEGQLMVVHSQHPEIKRGDVLLAANGMPAEDYYQLLYSRVSASPHGRKYWALFNLSRYEKDQTVVFDLARGDEKIKVSVADEDKPYEAPKKYNRIHEVEPGVWYVDLTRVSYKEAIPYMERFAKAKGIIWDMRGYPTGSVIPFVGHLLKESSLSPYWLVPRIIYPDQKDMLFSEYRWPIEPELPYLGGKMVLLTSPRAQSYAETVSSFYEAYDLATIVGQPTTGTNGTVVPRYLPGGYKLAWTGMRVIKQDGSQHHLIGTVPDILVTPTRAGILEGRDEYVEKGIEVILTQSAEAVQISKEQ